MASKLGFELEVVGVREGVILCLSNTKLLHGKFQFFWGRGDSKRDQKWTKGRKLGLNFGGILC